MDIPTDSHQVRRLEIVETGRRRRFSLEKKLEIVGESLARRGAASATARRHGISNTLLFSWRKAFREGRLGGTRAVEFVPAVIGVEASAGRLSDSSSRVEIVSPTGWRILVRTDIEAGALGRVLAAIDRRAGERSSGEGR
jgi:transposase